MRHISGLKFMLLGGLFSPFPLFANAGDSQAAWIRLHETVRVTGVILKGISRPSPQSDLRAGAYSYVKLDHPINFVDSDGTAVGRTFRHQLTLGIGASKTALAVSLGQNYGKHVALVGHINASVDTTHFDAPFDLQFDVTQPIEPAGQ